MARGRGSRLLDGDPLKIGAVIVMVAAIIFAVVAFKVGNRSAPAYTPAPQASAAVQTPAPAAQLPKPADGLDVLYAGDSLTHGSFASSEANTFPALITSVLAAQEPTRTTMVGRAGQTATQALQKNVAADAPAADLIFVEYGANDVDKGTVQQFSQDYPALLNQLLTASPGASLVCAGPWGGLPKTQPFDAVVQQACQDHKGQFVQLSALYGDRELHATPGAPAIGGPAGDNFHPGDAGHRRIAGALLAPFGLALPQP